MSHRMSLDSNRRRNGRAATSAEQGSAYLIALLALVVLSIVGLALASITQTENQLASNERTIQRVFYAADTGLSASLARALVNPGTTGFTLDLPEPNTPTDLASRQIVETSPTFPILDAPCNLCGVNNAGHAAGSYGGESAFSSKLTYALTATATRQAPVGDDTAVLAQKTLASMFDVEPWRSLIETYQPLQDPDELKKIRY